MSRAPSSPRAASKRGQAPAQRPRRRRVRRVLPPASATPHECVALAIDTAELSGWCAITGKDEFLAFGEADTLDGPALRYIVRWAQSHADRRGLPLVLVLESAWGGPAWVLLGLGAARERWLSAWRDEGLPKSRVVSVQPSEWRARVLGKRWSKARREEVRAHEQAIAAATVSQPVRGDEAAAILIARWAMRCAKVARVLPAGRRRR
jgi:hypothetical protein